MALPGPAHPEEERVQLLLTGLREKYGVPFVILTDLDLLQAGGEERFIRPIN